MYDDGQTSSKHSRRYWKKSTKRKSLGLDSELIIRHDVKYELKVLCPLICPTNFLDEYWCKKLQPQSLHGNEISKIDEGENEVTNTFCLRYVAVRLIVVDYGFIGLSATRCATLALRRRDFPRKAMLIGSSTTTVEEHCHIHRDGYEKIVSVLVC